MGTCSANHLFEASLSYEVYGRGAVSDRLSGRRDGSRLISLSCVSGLLDAAAGGLFCSVTFILPCLDVTLVGKQIADSRVLKLMTVLAKKNNGVFPFNSVREIIDGRKTVVAHGTRDMPIWGDRYAPEPSKGLIPRPSENILSLFYDPEAVVRMRILAVIDYLNRIQEK